jgi:hypothetical protein
MEPLPCKGPDPIRLPLTDPALHSPAMRHSLGKFVATAAIAASVLHLQIIGLLDRHATGDWGDLSDEDKAANDNAGSTGNGRLFSSHATSAQGKLWLITDDFRGRARG